MKRRLVYFNWVWIVGLVGLGLGLRIHRLDEIPGEMWGDVIEHYDRTRQVLETGSVTDWFGGDGPLLTYLHAVVAKVFGLSFWSLKLTTAILGSGVVLGGYLYARALTNNVRVGWLVGFMLAVWYWSVSYSRQAKPYILVPLLLSLVLWSLMTKRRVWAGLFGGMGMYAQAAFWGLAGLAFYHPLTLVIWSLMVLPGKEQFLRLMSPTSYVGQKMAESLTLGEYLRRIGVNLTHNIGGLLWRGDPGFRGVIPLAPFLDWVSIILFIVGVGVVGWNIWKEKKWIYWWYLVVPFFLVQLPSVLDVENFQFSPNSGRILGILPLVAVVTGMGIECLMRYIKHHAWRLAIGIMVLGWIGMLNFRLYFQTYPTTLPNENTPYGKIIADFVSTDRWVSTVVVLVDGCCWGEWGQPEPRAIKYRMKNPNRFYYLPNTDLGLRQLAFDVPEGAEVVVVSRPNEDVPGQLFQALYSPSKYELLIDGHEVARLTVGNLVNDSAFKALENGDVIEIE